MSALCVEYVDSLADPRLDDYREVRDRELLRARSLFVVEGRERGLRTLQLERIPQIAGIHHEGERVEFVDRIGNVDIPRPKQATEFTARDRTGDVERFVASLKMNGRKRWIESVGGIRN